MSTTVVDDLRVEVVSKHNLVTINQFYSACGYLGSATGDDQVLGALREKKLLGCIRISREQGILVIRGLQVRGKYQHQGIGTALLQQALELVKDEECYTVPYVDLVKFFSRNGFREIDPALAPMFLLQRLNKYRELGQKMVLMMR